MTDTRKKDPARWLRLGDHVEIARRVIEQVAETEIASLGERHRSSIRLGRVGSTVGLRFQDDGTWRDGDAWPEDDLVSMIAAFSGHKVEVPSPGCGGGVRLSYEDVRGILDLVKALALDWSPEDDT